MPEPGSALKGEEGKGTVGDKNPGDSAGAGNNTEDSGSKVGGVAQGSDDNARPGAGSSTLEPSQGSNKTGDESGGLLSKD